VIQGIYPVIIASGNYDICFQQLVYGVDVVFHGNPFTFPYNTDPITPSASFASTEFYGPSIGATLADVSGQEILISLSSSLLEDPITDSLSVTGVGFAIYYTSATPTTDPLMPPPFAVPAGQGLTWSVPLAVALDFNAVTGTASGTPASNGSIPPAGLWRLADNKREYATDIDRDTPLIFPFKEYR
jgi:hypothetical protein